MKAKSISPEGMAERLKGALAERLQSVILYGSAAAGDFMARSSDYNLLVVVDRLGVDELAALSKPTRAWVREGNPPPLCFAADRFLQSADVFPLELRDIQDQHRVLFGRDIVEGIEVSDRNLRHQLEYELRSKLLRLREEYLLANGNARRTVDLMVNSLSSFLALFRGALRLFRKEIKATKIEALRLLSVELEFSGDVFELVHDIRGGGRSRNDLDAPALFQRYLAAIETVVDKVDRALQRTPE